MKGLIAAYELDGAGGGRRLPPDFDPDTAETGSTNPEAPLWLQFDRMDPDTSQWLEDRPDISESCGSRCWRRTPGPGASSGRTACC